MANQKMKKGSGWWKRIFAVIIIAVFLMIAGFAAVSKGYDLYTRLSKKMDYMDNLLYLLGEDVAGIQRILRNKYSDYAFDYEWAKENRLVAHAFGGIDGKTYTNSREAFLYNYNKGHRVFEVDFDVTEPEGMLVLSHDVESWRYMAGGDAGLSFTYEHFNDKLLCGKYESMDYRELIDLLVEYPDVYIVTDTKYQDEATVYMQFSQMVRYARERDESVLKRIVPQIYQEQMLDWVMAVYPFDSVIFTLYSTEWTKESVADFCGRTGVGFVTLPTYAASKELIDFWQERGIIVAAHTSNDRTETQRCFSDGLDMMYTDFLLPEDFR